MAQILFMKKKDSLFAIKIRIIKNLIIICFLLLFIMFILTDGCQAQTKFDFQSFTGIKLNSKGSFETARCDIAGNTSNKFLQPTFGVKLATPYVDVTASASTAYGSYMALLLQASVQGYPFTIWQPDWDLGSIEIGKLFIIELGVELDDTRSPMFGTFIGFGLNISFPIFNGDANLSFERIRPTKPSRSFWEFKAIYSFNKKMPKNLQKNKNKYYF